MNNNLPTVPRYSNPEAVTGNTQPLNQEPSNELLLLKEEILTTMDKLT